MDLARIRRDGINKHVDSDGRLTEEIEQHNLERCKKTEEEEPPEHVSRFFLEGKSYPVTCQWQQDADGASQQRGRLGEKHEHIGQNEHAQENPIDDMLVFKITHFYLIEN